MKTRHLLLFLLGLITLPGGAATRTVTEGEFTFTYDDTNTNVAPALTRTTFIGEHLVIPATFTGLDGVVRTVLNINAGILRYSSPANASAVKTITIPGTIRSIHTNAFGLGTAIERFIIDGTSQHYSVEDGILYDKNKTTLVQYPSMKSTEGYTLPASVSTLSGAAFSNHQLLTTFTIPAQITSMANGTISANPGSSGTFFNCPNLTSVTFEAGSTLTRIPTMCFAKSANLGAITLPESITAIGDYAFDNCESVVLTLPPNLKTLGSRAFQSCTSLPRHLVLPKTLETMGSEVYNNASSFLSITIPQDGALRTLPVNAFRLNRELVEVNLNDNLTTIGSGAFEQCSRLPGITLPAELKTIGERAFYECTKLTGVAIPSKVTTIGHGAFASCNLTSVHIPASVTSIGVVPFGNNQRLTEITVDPASTSFTSIEGVLFSADRKTLYAYPAASQRRISYTVPYGTEVILDGALSHVSLTHITLPSTLTTIHNAAFAENPKLTELTIPASVTSIGNLVDNTGTSSLTLRYKNIIYNTQVKSLFLTTSNTPPSLATPYQNGPSRYVVPNHGPSYSTTMPTYYPTMYMPKAAYDNNIYASAGLWSQIPSAQWAYEIPVTLPASGLKTMARDFNVDLSDTPLYAFQTTGLETKDGNLVMKMRRTRISGHTWGKYVPARAGVTYNDSLGYEQGYENYAPVILRGKANTTYTYRIGRHDHTSLTYGSNHLVPATDDTKVGVTEMRDGVEYTNLALNTGYFRFLNAPGTLGYNKCYLSVPTSMLTKTGSGAKQLVLQFLSDEEEEATGIGPATAAHTEEPPCYNLQGLRVTNPRPGVYIREGKKVFIQ